MYFVNFDSTMYFVNFVLMYQSFIKKVTDKLEYNTTTSYNKKMNGLASCLVIWNSTRIILCDIM